MNSVMIVVKEKTLYIHMGEILKIGKLSISNNEGETVFQEKITNSHYEIITLDRPKGKYWINIDSEILKTKRSFILK